MRSRSGGRGRAESQRGSPALGQSRSESAMPLGRADSACGRPATRVNDISRRSSSPPEAPRRRSAARSDEPMAGERPAPSAVAITTRSRPRTGTTRDGPALGRVDPDGARDAALGCACAGFANKVLPSRQAATSRPHRRVIGRCRPQRPLPTRRLPTLGGTKRWDRRVTGAPGRHH